jgi:hypothetical protein
VDVVDVVLTVLVLLVEGRVVVLDELVLVDVVVDGTVVEVVGAREVEVVVVSGAEVEEVEVVEERVEEVVVEDGSGSGSVVEEVVEERTEVVVVVSGTEVEVVEVDVRVEEVVVEDGSGSGSVDEVVVGERTVVVVVVSGTEVEVVDEVATVEDVVVDEVVVVGPGAGVHGLISEVLPSASMATADRNSPASTGRTREAVNSAWPSPSVITAIVPTRSFASPYPEASHASFAKISIVAASVGVLSNVPAMVVPPAKPSASSGKFSRSFTPVSMSPASLGVGDATPMSMAREPLSWMLLPSMRLPVPPLIATVTPLVAL